jgi:dCTP deaminase
MSGILTDHEIKEEARFGLIKPFVAEKVRHLGLSHGLSSFGYDLRLGRKFLLPNSNYRGAIDPANFDPDAMLPVEVTRDGDYITVPPNSFVLGETLEYINVPTDVIGICMGKSTYARCGLVLNTTPLEPGWRGYVTLEFSNTTKHPIILRPGAGCCQVLFFRGGHAPTTAYGEGKYQDQTGVTAPKAA